MKFFPKKYLLYGLIPVLVFALIFGATYFFLSLQKAKKAENPTNGTSDAPQENVILNTSPVATPNGDRVNILLMGYGGAGHQGGTLMDSIILVSINTKTKKAALISIPRDLWFPYPSGQFKINEGYRLGGATNGWNLMKNAVATVTGFKVDNFAAIDFVPFQRLVATLGGIEVTIPKTFDDPFYPVEGLELDLCGKSPEEVATLHQKYSGFELERQFSCRYKHLHYDPGLVHMEGGPALEYVRSRHGDGDFGRSERQFTVLAAIAKKVISLNVVRRGSATLSTLLKMVRTNLDVNAILVLADFIGDPKAYQTVSIHLTDGNVLVQSKGPGGAFILVPKEGEDKWTAIQNYIFERL